MRYNVLSEFFSLSTTTGTDLPMAKRERVERTIEFWKDKRIHRYLLTGNTIALLSTTLKDLKRRKRFSIEHANALKLAVSLMESQMRDCIRLAIDSIYSGIDVESDFLKDLKIDTALLQGMRSRHFTLGEFVFLNTSISTVEKLFQAVEFCFRYKVDVSFDHWLKEASRKPYSWDDLKASLAWVFKERNKYVHELFDETTLAFGKAAPPSAFFLHLDQALDFLLFIQNDKEQRYTQEYSEEHPYRGEIAKRLNRATTRIRKRIHEIGTFIRSLDSNTGQLAIDGRIEGLRSSFERLITLWPEYVSTMCEFEAYAHGPGTMATDVALMVRFDELRSFERRLKQGWELMQVYRHIPPSHE